MIEDLAVSYGVFALMMTNTIIFLCLAVFHANAKEKLDEIEEKIGEIDND